MAETVSLRTKLQDISIDLDTLVAVDRETVGSPIGSSSTFRQAASCRRSTVWRSYRPTSRRAQFRGWSWSQRPRIRGYATWRRTEPEVILGTPSFRTRWERCAAPWAADDQRVWTDFLPAARGRRSDTATAVARKCHGMRRSRQPPSTPPIRRERGAFTDGKTDDPTAGFMRRLLTLNQSLLPTAGHTRLPCHDGRNGAPHFGPNR